MDNRQPISSGPEQPYMPIQVDPIPVAPVVTAPAPAAPVVITTAPVASVVPAAAPAVSGDSDARAENSTLNKALVITIGISVLLFVGFILVVFLAKIGVTAAEEPPTEGTEQATPGLSTNRPPIVVNESGGSEHLYPNRNNRWQQVAPFLDPDILKIIATDRTDRAVKTCIWVFALCGLTLTGLGVGLNSGTTFSQIREQIQDLREFEKKESGHEEEPSGEL